MPHLLSAARLIAAAAVPAALVACSSGSVQALAPSPTTSVKPRAVPTSANPDAGLLTGTQLKTALAPASFFPAGFVTDASGTRDSGPYYEAPDVTSVPKPDCTKLGGTSWTNITGIAGVSFAQNDYLDKTTTSEIAQEIDVYRGQTAQTVMGKLTGISAVCPSYSDFQTNSKVTVGGKAESGLGDGAYIITLTDPAWQEGSTLVAARVGTAVVTVLSTYGTDNGSASALKLTGQIVAALKGKA
jgi:hypothetical protein